jgi:hypothetical protein
MAGGPGAGTAGVFVLGNRFTGLGRGAGLPGIAVAAGGNAARLADVWVAGNHMVGVHVPISVVGGAANAVNEAARGNVVERVRVLENVAEQGTGASWVSLAETTPLPPSAVGFAKTFHDVCPTAYGYQFDDKAGTFNCVGQSATNQVGYTTPSFPDRLRLAAGAGRHPTA